MSAEQPTDPEDLKIITLARSSRARTHAREGAAVRDIDGRTYAATSVDLSSLALTAIQVAVAMAVSSGASGLEAAAIVGSDQLGDDALAVVRELAGGRPVSIWLAAMDGTVTDVVHT